ncbi:MAG: ACT domain-containing protein, partial [Sulfuricella sp.]
MKNTAILLISCPDRKGLVATIAEFLYRHNANILHADQHQDSANGLFLMRVEWDLEGFDLAPEDFNQHFAHIAHQFEMQWRLALSSQRPRVAIFVSRYDHCLADLLYRHQSGELHCEIPLIIGNHSDTKWLADTYRIPFQHIEVLKDAKEEAERDQLALLRHHHID